MTKIAVRGNNVEGALRTLKQRIAKSGDQKKLRERHEGYLKPGVKRRLAEKEARKNSRRNERRDRERY